MGFEFPIGLAEGLRFYLCLPKVFTDNAKVLTFKLRGLTAATNVYHFLDAYIKKVL
ncbi:unnamed protein product [Penicillium roqueforti FM164]|uniref:Uncharacterized protein n=1 Tax=Penicillium roqueforti (strain FM164) TaxID=1365484 RepID=W6QNJ4_PENRF|nr:unnamed protein product [Penicillium roqueforti FM164]